jgi:integrase
LKEEYDATTGRITRKRSKTQKSKNTPTVCYKLWDETKELLDQEIAKSNNYPQKQDAAPFLLVNSKGSRLWYEFMKDGKTAKNDTISRNFKRLVAKVCNQYPSMPRIAYYQLRKTSASLISNEPKYRMFNELWLGHAPHSVADRHYNALDDTILDECLAWLHDKYFGLETPSSASEKSEVNDDNT